MSEGGVGLAAVLAEHQRTQPVVADGKAGCVCRGWRGRWAGYDQHIADVVLDHLAAKASEAAVVEAVVRAIVAVDDVAYADGLDSATAQDAATAALTAFLGALGGSVAAAGVEVAPGATDEVLGRQKGGNACGSRMSWDREAEPCSGFEGHVGHHVNSYCIWSDK